MALIAAPGVLCSQSNMCPQLSPAHRCENRDAATPTAKVRINSFLVPSRAHELRRRVFKTGSRIAGSEAGGKIVCQSLGERTATSLSAPETETTSKDPSKDPSTIQQSMAISPTLASRWREIQGANDWEGLLDPLDMDLRLELIRYGEFAQACYDAFDKYPHSKYMGSNLFSMDRMLEKVGLPDSGYQVTDYLFATTSVESLLLRNSAKDAWSRDSNWIGFIAVCVDEEKVKQMGRRDILLAWRGTATKLEWAANLAKRLTPSTIDSRADEAVPWHSTVMMEEGFMNLYTTANSQTRYNRDSVRVQVLNELKRLIRLYDSDDLSITVTGHSLGGAMAVLSAYDIAMSGVNRHGAGEEVKDIQEKTTPTPTSDPGKTPQDSARGSIPVTAFTFAGPRVGNGPFRKKMRDLGVKVLRVTNVHDLVPNVPGPILNEDFKMMGNILEKLPWTYFHVGSNIKVDHELSPHLAGRGNPLNAHNLEAYVHLLTGYHGPGRAWDPVVERDLALVNKASDFVCPKETGIPTNWWQLENKGLIRTGKGSWEQLERDYEDLPLRVMEKKQEDAARREGEEES